MKKIICAWIILFIANPSVITAQEKLVAGKNNTISVSSFTITFPDKYLQGNAKWTIRKKSDEFDVIELVGIDESGIPILAYTMKKYTMEFFINEILSDSIRLLTNDTIAANFFDHQLKEMIEQDAKDKNMAIRDHRTGYDTINSKYFYTFTYAVQNKKENYVVLGYLYIYFPGDSGNKEFFVAYFSEPMNATAYKKSSVAKWLGCFREILSTLVIHEKSPS